ncbi:MAG: T9SS type A sorting domain-containing protein [Bacteroidia bacterium]|jgi:hypothetical protein
MKNYVTLFIFICLGYVAHGQVIKFEKIYGGTGYDFGYSVVQTKDKGYVIAGSTTSFGNESADMYIFKTDSAGTLKWQKKIGGINIERAFSIKETTDTGFVISGYTNSFGSGGYDIYLIKANKLGDTSWTKTYGGTDWDFGYSVEQTADGGYIIAGGTYSYGKGNEDMYLIKTNPTGDTIWTKTYGGLAADEANCVTQTSDGGYILTGYTKSFGDEGGDLFTVKTNSLGDTLWTKKLNFPGADNAYQIIQTTDGGYMVAGVSESVAGGFSEAILVKTNVIGDTIYTRRYGAPNDAAAYSVCQTVDGGYAWVGKLKIGSEYKVYLYKIDAFANWNFSYTLGSYGNNEGRYIQQTIDHGYIVVGNTTGFNNGLGDVYLFKTDSVGVASGTVINLATDISSATEYISIPMVIYPNPVTNGVCNVILPQLSGTVELKLYSVSGQMISNQTIESQKTQSRTIFEFTTSAIKNGMYFVEIIAENTRYITKISVQNN